MLARDSHSLITFALISYRDARYIEQAVAGALAQTYQPLEIILSNDCSSDGTFAIITKMAAAYRGPHKLILNRNERNLGTGGHINRIMELSHGEIIVIAAGDDISLPERTEKLSAVFKKGRGRIKSVFSNSLVIDESGNGSIHQYIEPLPHDEFLLENIVRNRDFGIVAGSSHAWTRDLFETFGPLATPLSVEDSAIAFRAALLGRIAFTDQVLVKHRRHAGNTWHYTNADPVSSHRYKTLERDAVWRNWLHDIDVLEKHEPGRKKELERYRRVLHRRIASQEDLALYRSPWMRRARMITSEIFSGMPLRIARKKIGFFLVPGLYRRYLTMRYQHRLGSGASRGKSAGTR